MMLIAIVILLFSSFVQGVMSNYLGYAYDNLSIFSTIYVLIALLILNPYFENKKKFFALLVVFGLITDIVYADSSMLNTFLYIVCYYISRLFHFFFPYNWITISVSNLLCIFCYHIMSFLLLSVLKYDIYSISILSKILSHSILMTIIYSNIVYVIITVLVEKFQIKEVK